jgi:AcrR family transcriptional regulator
VTADTPGTSEQVGTRERLLAAAREEFAAKGLRQASVRDIARRAGSNHASIGYHFSSKEALYREVLEDACQDIRKLAEDEETLLAAVEASGSRMLAWDALERSILGFLSHQLANEHTSLAAKLLRHELEYPEGPSRELDELFIRPRMRRTKALLALARPDLDPVMVDSLSITLIGMCANFGCSRDLVLRYLGADHYDEQTTEHMTAAVLHFMQGALKPALDDPHST